ncbi:MAG: hypothetical protein WDN02_01745 [Methylovirgula sp.]|uniref:hypothetical protein n=1 Tax=Methylovirgula sp. TaxID=1978224 RepID=UPI0030767E0E
MMQNRHYAIEWQQPLSLATLMAASVAFSLGLACAVPLVAFAALGALTLDRRMGLLIIIGIVAANQILGFTVLHYPHDAATVAWTPAFLFVGIIATLTAFWTKRRCAGLHPTVTVLATFVAAFACYEGGFFLISLLTRSGLYAYAPSIILRILETNALAFAGLWLIRRIAMALRTPAVKSTAPFRPLPTTFIQD